MTNQYYTGIKTLSEIRYQKPGIAVFPSLQSLPLKVGFSWGENMSSMTYKNTDKQKVDKRHQAFFNQLDLPSQRILIDPNLPTQNELLEVTDSLFDNQEEIITGSNILFTKSNTITLVAHPGDCPCAIIFAKDKNKQPLLGLIHLGRKQTDKRLAEQAIQYLKKQNVFLSSISIGICPGISQKNYFIPVSKQAKDLPNANLWKNHKEIKTVNGEERLYLDLQGYIIEQFLTVGIWPEHIEIYTIDTYSSAENGESFSHRYATVTNQTEKDGRFLLAASLN